MKKSLIIASFVAATLILTGCGSSSSGGTVAPPPGPGTGLTTLFLIDQNGFSLDNVPYICDSMANWDVTAGNGEFTFIPGESCYFDFMGFDGDLNGDIIYIVDDLYNGAGGIPYDCDLYGAGTTFGDGSFEYDFDDACAFYL